MLCMAREEVPMSLRRTIVEIDTSTVNVTEFCRSHGVSTWFFWDLRRRHAQLGDIVLEPASRAPKQVANKTPLEVEDAIVRARKELLDAGLDAGADSIEFHLRDLDGLPSRSTIWRILRARGWVTPEPRKAPRSSGRSFCAERANDCWQLDDTSWELADGSPVKILDVIDDHSRLAVASVAMTTCTGAAALAVVAEAATVIGWPARFLSDNARAFRHVLADALAPMGIAAGHSRPYHPQTNGKVERFHQTLKRWLTRQPPAATIPELQAQLDLFRLIYNHHRPHRSLERRFPAQVWTHAPKSAPSDRPIDTPTEIHHGIVRDGQIHITHRYRITLGAAYNRQRGLAVITGTNCHVFIDGRLIRHLTLNPARRSQALHHRPGRPRQLP
jgi:transposase InsO family protein